jgi:hypothetical protein
MGNFDFYMQWDGNATQLMPEFWEGKEIISYLDQIEVIGISFYAYGYRAEMTNVKPVLEEDKRDGLTYLTLEGLTKNATKFRASWPRYIIYFFILIPTRWLVNMYKGIITDIFN